MINNIILLFIIMFLRLRKITSVSQQIKKYYSSFKPPPISINHESFSDKPFNGRKLDEVIKGRHEHLSPSLATFQAFQNPFYLTRARMQYLWDEKGKRHLDLLAQNLTISVGHNHPYVMDAIQKQMNNIVHSTTMYYNESPIKCAEELKKTLPSKHDWVVHFVNSGSEAIDLAMLLARAYTKSWDILSLRNSYHGLHSTAMGATGLYKCKQDFPTDFGIKHVVQPDMYRGIFSDLDEETAVKKYAQEVENTITYSTPGKVAGFLFEQVQGYGGIYHLPQGYLPRVSKYVKDAGGLIIADEVQSGFGRMGTCYWSYELQDIDPDIIVTAKGLGNGLPIAAVMVKREIAEAMTHKQFFNTYGGNPTVCAAGLAVLETIKKENIQERTHKVGNVFKESLLNVQKKYPNVIGDIRGQGLMYGVDIVKDPETKEPNSELAVDVFELMKDNGVIMGLGSLHKNTLRVMPPMCVNEKDAKFMEEVFLYSLEKCL